LYCAATVSSGGSRCSCPTWAVSSAPGSTCSSWECTYPSRGGTATRRKWSTYCLSHPGQIKHLLEAGIGNPQDRLCIVIKFIINADVMTSKFTIFAVRWRRSKIVHKSSNVSCKNTRFIC
ncbi:hypothetical protein IscW_ISCW003956, partial [Ixodes scapularis]